MAKAESAPSGLAPNALTSLYERELSQVLSAGAGLCAVLFAVVLATATLAAGPHKATERPACCKPALLPHSH